MRLTIRRRAVRFAVHWHTRLLAGRALTAAVYGEHRRSRDLTARAVRHGPSAVERLVAVWCREILSDRATGPVFLDPGRGGRVDIDRVPPPARWGARVLAAAEARDRVMLPALVAAVPTEELEPHLAGLLRLAAAAVLARDDGTWP